jgi:hypothetical protein
MLKYIAGRIPTIKRLDEGWAAFQAAERDVTRSGILRQSNGEEESPLCAPDLNRLTDEEVDTDLKLKCCSIRRLVEIQARREGIARVIVECFK